MVNKTNTIANKTNPENIIKHEISNFLKIYKECNIESIDDFLAIINGGVIDGVTVDGFINLKVKILTLLKEPINRKCITLINIESYINNKKNNK